MQENQDILDLINRFWGGFVLNISQDQVKEVVTEFIEKIKNLEKQLNVTQDVYKDFKKKLHEV